MVSFVKQFRQYYLLPGALMLVLGLYIYWNAWYISDRTRKTAITAGIGIVVFLLIFQTPMTYSWASWRIGYRDACRNIEKHIQDYFPNSPFASARSAVTMSHALKHLRGFIANRGF